MILFSYDVMCSFSLHPQLLNLNGSLISVFGLQLHYNKNLIIIMMVRFWLCSDNYFHFSIKSTGCSVVNTLLNNHTKSMRVLFYLLKLHYAKYMGSFKFSHQIIVSIETKYLPNVFLFRVLISNLYFKTFRRSKYMYRCL